MGNCWPIFRVIGNCWPLHRPPMDAIESIREMYQKIDPVEQIDPLITFFENRLQKINKPPEAGSSSSDGCVATVLNIAAKTIDTISTEVEKVSNSDAKNTLGSLTSSVINRIGNSYWVFIGLSVAAYATENCLRVGSTDKECREILLNIVELVKDANEYSKRMSERDQLCNAVGTILEGAFILCDYLKRGKDSRTS